jgi:hypothetical protein
VILIDFLAALDHGHAIALNVFTHDDARDARGERLHGRHVSADSSPNARLRPSDLLVFYAAAQQRGLDAMKARRQQPPQQHSPLPR